MRSSFYILIPKLSQEYKVNDKARYMPLTIYIQGLSTTGPIILVEVLFTEME